MTKACVIVHIGYHKSGTTLLQRCIFSNPKSGFEKIGDVSELDATFVRAGNFSFDGAQARNQFIPRIERALEADLIPIISYERFSGMPHRGGYDSKLQADRLYDTFPDSRIIMVIREQKSMIMSLYKTYVRMGGVANLKHYMPRDGNDAGAILFRYDYLYYDKLIAYYQQLFGKDRVLVLPYEFLNARPRRFLTRLQSFSGAQARGDLRMPSVNPSLSPLATYGLMHVNRWLVRTIHNPAPIFFTSPLKNITARRSASSVNQKLTPYMKNIGQRAWEGYISEEIGDLYKKSNSETAKLTGLDLKGYGYQCEDDLATSKTDGGGSL